MNRWMFIAGLIFCCLCSTGTLGQDKKQIPLAKETEKKPGLLCLHDCGSDTERRFDVNNKTYKGETIRGPRKVVAYNINPLRYAYKWQSEVTYTPGPDLWSKLTGLAAPQSSPTQPAAPKTQAPTAAGAQPGHAMRTNVQIATEARKMVAQGEPPISQATKDLAKKAQSAIDEAVLAVANVNDQIQGIDDSLKTDVNADFAKVSIQVGLANAALKSVSDAGQELVEFLSKSGADSLNTGIQNELSGSADYKFMLGVNAQWLNLEDLTNLRNSVDSRKNLLTSKKTALDALQPSLLAAVNVAERDLVTASGSLKQQLIVLAGTRTSQAELDLLNKSIADIEPRISELDLAKRNLQFASETLNWAITESTVMQTSLSNLDASSDKYKSFQTGQATLVSWKNYMLQLRAQIDAYQQDKVHNNDPLVTSFSAGCDYTFASTKKNAIKLTQVDNLPDKSAAAPTDVLALTMECASPFAVSAGVAFSTIPNSQFAIQPVATPPASTTTVNKFVQTSNSSFHPAPLGMVSARLCEPNETISVHISLGISGNFNSQANGGSSAGFLIGPSIGLFRTMFFTPGWYIGTRPTLGSGFHVGDPAPTNVTTPPINSSYTSGFGLAITFTKP